MSELGPHFTEDELRCRGSGLFRLRKFFGPELAALRFTYGRPMVITSGCRSTEHNKAVGGAPASYHLLDHRWPDGSIGTLAVDVRVANAAEAWRLAGLAIDAGWSVGVPKTGFLHLDARHLVGAPPALFGY